MCGITGWIDWERDISREPEILQAMVDTLAVRGPDDSGFYFSGHAALGHRRLSVVDLEGGRQPMIRRRGENTYVITYNGTCSCGLPLQRTYSTIPLHSSSRLASGPFSPTWVSSS